MKFSTRFASALCLAALALGAVSGPAAARDSYVDDGAGLFSAATVSGLNTKIGDFNRQTGKEVVVVSVPSLNGTSIADATERTFAQKQVNGVLIFLAKAEKQDRIVGDRASRAFFPPGEFQSIHDAMTGYFRTGDFDKGINVGVDLVLAQYRSHERNGASAAAGQQQQTAPATKSQSFGGFMSLVWLILILIAGFLIIRALFRAMAGPRPMPPGYGQGPGGPGYGPGMGGGYGYGGGGGGSFFSGLLGGLGGAFLGNELFGRGQGIGLGNPGQAGVAGDPGAAPDAAGWQSDAGQIDAGNAGGGGWGDTGGGFDSGGGGFDGGGGGGDGGGW
ncbi:MAG TPA: TPM domain-containing protein [Candidatus Baltobacteraceae bacterium]|nr:TPM domain-containing protein [Candidatus Baltobacteraceae bacterium]